MKQRTLGALAYIIPSFPIAYFWHLHTFAPNYAALEVYRADIIVPFGFAAMLIQGFVWSWLYGRLFAGEPILRGALKFAAFALPIALSFAVIAISAKHRMNSAAGYFMLESVFMLVQYAIVSPCIAWVYRQKK